MKLWIHMKRKVQSLRLVTHSFQKRGLQEFQVQLHSGSVELSLVAKPTGMSQPAPQSTIKPPLLLKISLAGFISVH